MMSLLAQFQAPWTRPRTFPPHRALQARNALGPARSPLLLLAPPPLLVCLPTRWLCPKTTMRTLLLSLVQLNDAGSLPHVPNLLRPSPRLANQPIVHLRRPLPQSLHLHHPPPRLHLYQVQCRRRARRRDGGRSRGLRRCPISIKPVCLLYSIPFLFPLLVRRFIIHLLG